MKLPFLSKKQVGFTLIELLVSISIVAIISAVGVTLFSQAQKTARDGRRQADLGEIQKALEQYYSVNQNYPDGTTIVYPTALNSYFASGAAPRDPSTNTNYSYFGCSTNTNRYNICSTLETCGSKCNLSAMPSNGCTAAPVPAASNTVLCRSNISSN